SSGSGAQVVPIQAIVALKSGSVKGQKTLKMFMTTPKGIEAYHHEQPVVFEGDGHGVVIHVTFGLQPNEEGLWWCDVEVDGKTLTRMALQVVYQESDDRNPDRPPGNRSAN